MGHFELVGADMQGSSKYMMVRYKGEASANPTGCSSEAPPNFVASGNGVQPTSTPETPGSEGGAQPTSTPETPSSGSGVQPTPTPQIPGQGNNNPKSEEYNVVGTVEVDRVWREMVSSGSGYTNDIVLVMDTSASMAWDWNNRSSGQSGYTGARLNDAKQALSAFVRSYDVSPQTGDPDARIAFVTFGGSRDDRNLAVTVQSPWDTACNNVATQGCGEDDKWSTVQREVNRMAASGFTPGPLAFEEVEQLLKQRRTPPTGKTYRQIVIFASGSVFNVCGAQGGGSQQCPTTYKVPVPAGTKEADKPSYYNSPSYNMVSGRPIWQAQQVTNRIRTAGAQIFMVALTPQCQSNQAYCFDPQGLKEMSGGNYFGANSSAALTNVYQQIRDQMVGSTTTTCVPYEQREAANGARVILTQPNNPTWKKETTTTRNGSFAFNGVLAGQYIVTVAPLDRISSEDGKTRRYSRVLNARNLNEEGQASVAVSADVADKKAVSSELTLSLPTQAGGTPNNGCTTP
jgi:hypothetical protein